jgi:tRNA (guanine37-N1)-methyltransferase
MRIDIVTIFPAMVEGALQAGVVGRAIERGTLDVRVHDLREYTTDRHRVVDDVPYGGGPGMVLKPEQPHVLILCGRYEGVDERVRSRVDEEVSIGDYVLSGGELAALVITDVAARFIPGVVGDEQSVVDDSFSRGLLDFPQYTRPAAIAGTSDDDRLKVPDVLLSGNHAEIRRWRKRQSLTRTLARRPDLLDEASLDEEEREILRELKQGKA